MIPTEDNVIVVRENVDLEFVQELLTSQYSFINAIGHDSTAQLLNHILERKDLFVKNRIQVEAKAGDKILVIQVKQRLEEGKIYTFEELKEIPYGFVLMSLYGSDYGVYRHDQVKEHMTDNAMPFSHSIK